MKSSKVHTYPYHFFLAIMLIFAFAVPFIIKKYSNPKFRIQPINNVPATNQANSISKDTVLERLVSKDWFWVETVLDSSVGIKPYNLTAFKINFKKDLTFSSTSDCNNIGGNFEIFENKIKIKDIVRSEKYCMKSRENDFVEGLAGVSEILFNEKNELILRFKDSTSYMRLR